VVYFVQHFKQYLLGRQFAVRTYHSALSWLKKTPEPIGQNARWLEILGEYDFVIRHRPGRQHGNADALSRHPCLNRPSCTVCHPVMANSVKIATLQESPQRQNDNASDTVQSPNSDGPADQNLNQQATVETTPINMTDVTEQDVQINWSGAEIMLEQLQDLDIGFIIQLMGSHQEKPPWSAVEMQSSEVKTLWNEWNRLSLRTQFHVLCRKYESTDGLHVIWQIVLPHSLR